MLGFYYRSRPVYELVALVLACDKFTDVVEIIVILFFYKLLCKQMTQCFASIRMSNYS